MKIMHVINSSGLGGAETIVREIVARRKDLVFCLRREKVERFSEVSKDVFFGTRTPFYKLNPFIFFKILRTVKRNRVEVVHSHLANSIFYSVLLKVFVENLKVIHHEHGEVYRNSFLIFFLKRFHKRVDLFLAVSESTKTKLIEKVGIAEERIRVLYNFVDLEKFRLSDRRVDSSKFTIGFAGRLCEVKGCQYLLEALQHLNLDYRVLVAGDGVLRQELEDMANDRVEFLGYINDMDKFYSQLDVYVMPSLSEASPMAFYEAQAYGIPVVGSRVSAIDEFVFDSLNGFLFEKGNPRDLAEKITWIYEDPELRERMAQYAVDNIQKYSLENYLKNLEEIYEGEVF